MRVRGFFGRFRGRVGVPIQAFMTHFGLDLSGFVLGSLTVCAYMVVWSRPLGDGPLAEGVVVSVDDSLLGDDFWASYSSADGIRTWLSRTNPVFAEQVGKRVAAFGAFMMRAIGELVHADSTQFDDLFDIMDQDSPRNTFGGLMLSWSENEFGSVLKYLTAPDDKREEFYENSVFFLQLCALFSEMKDERDNRQESMPFLVGDVDDATGEVICWHGFLPWEDDPDKRHREYMSMEEWWYETFPEDRPEDE